MQLLLVLYNEYPTIIWKEIAKNVVLGMHLSKSLSQRPLSWHLKTVSPWLNSGLGWWSSLHLGLTSVPLSSILLQLTSWRLRLQSRYTFAGCSRGQTPAMRRKKYCTEKVWMRKLNRFGLYKYIVLKSLTQAQLYRGIPFAFWTVRIVGSAAVGE